VSHTQKDAKLKNKMIAAMFIAGKLETHQRYAFDAVFIAVFVPFENKDYHCSQWSCLSARFFSYEFVAYQPLQRCQISSVNKQQVETNKNICAIFIA